MFSSISDNPYDPSGLPIEPVEPAEVNLQKVLLDNPYIGPIALTVITYGMSAILNPRRALQGFRHIRQLTNAARIIQRDRISLPKMIKHPLTMEEKKLNQRWVKLQEIANDIIRKLEVGQEPSPSNLISLGKITQKIKKGIQGIKSPAIRSKNFNSLYSLENTVKEVYQNKIYYQRQFGSLHFIRNVARYVSQVADMIILPLISGVFTAVVLEKDFLTEEEYNQKWIEKFEVEKENLKEIRKTLENRKESYDVEFKKLVDNILVKLKELPEEDKELEEEIILFLVSLTTHNLEDEESINSDLNKIENYRLPLESLPSSISTMKKLAYYGGSGVVGGLFSVFSKRMRLLNKAIDVLTKKKILDKEKWKKTAVALVTGTAAVVINTMVEPNMLESEARNKNDQMFLRLNLEGISKNVDLTDIETFNRHPAKEGIKALTKILEAMKKKHLIKAIISTVARTMGSKQVPGLDDPVTKDGFQKIYEEGMQPYRNEIALLEKDISSFGQDSLAILREVNIILDQKIASNKQPKNLQ